MRFFFLRFWKEAFTVNFLGLRSMWYSFNNHFKSHKIFHSKLPKVTLFISSFLCNTERVSNSSSHLVFDTRHVSVEVTTRSKSEWRIGRAHNKGFLGSTSVEESTCQCRRSKNRGFDPWVGKIPWRREQQSTPVFLPGESHGQRSLVGGSPGS